MPLSNRKVSRCFILVFHTYIIVQDYFKKFVLHGTFSSELMITDTKEYRRSTFADRNTQGIDHEMN